MFQILLRAFIYIELLIPLASALFLLYAVGDLLLSWVIDLFRSSDVTNNSESVPLERSGCTKSGTAVIDTFSDAFKLPTPEFED